MSGVAVFQHSLKPSLRFAVFLLLLHMMAATAVYVTAIAWPIRLPILMLIFLSLFYYLVRDVLLLFPDSWREILFDKNGVSVTARDGSRRLGQVSHESVASPYFVVLCVKLEGRRLLVYRVVFPDALGAGAFRELCIYLKFA